MAVLLMLENILNIENMKIVLLIEIALILLVLLILFLLKGKLANLAISTFSKLIKSEYRPELYKIKEDIERPVSWIIFSIIVLCLIPVVPNLPASLDRFFTNVLKSILFIAIAHTLLDVLDLIINRVIKKDIEKHVDSYRGDNRTALQYLGVIIKTVVIIFVAFSVLELWLDNVQSLLAGLGIGGIALALAAQDTASNLVAGLAIMLDKPFDVGDWVETDAGSAFVAGSVEHMGLRSCRVRADDGNLLTVPNSVMGGNVIVNGTKRSQRLSSMQIPININTSAEKLEQFRNELIEVLEKDEHVVGDIKLNLVDFAPGAYIYHLRYTTSSDYTQHLIAKNSVNTKIVKLLADLGIEISNNVLYKMK